MKVSADYRMLALDALRGKWKTAVLTGIAASALGATIVSSSNSIVSNSDQAKDIHFELFSQPNGGRLLAVLLAGIVLWAILQLIVGGAVQLGYARFNLNLVDRKDAAVSDLFSQKDRLWDGFCMKFLQGLYIALWSLLLVIPGIVKSYSYAMTPYIMSEHPSLVKICDAFQITLSEFFAKAEGSESVPVALTPQQMQIIEKWSILRPDQQEAVLNLLNTIP